MTEIRQKVRIKKRSSVKRSQDVWYTRHYSLLGVRDERLPVQGQHLDSLFLLNLVGDVKTLAHTNKNEKKNQEGLKTNLQAGLTLNRNTRVLNMRRAKWKKNG